MWKAFLFPFQPRFGHIAGGRAWTGKAYNHFSAIDKLNFERSALTLNFGGLGVSRYSVGVTATKNPMGRVFFNGGLLAGGGVYYTYQDYYSSVRGGTVTQFFNFVIGIWDVPSAANDTWGMYFGGNTPFGAASNIVRFQFTRTTNHAVAFASIAPDTYQAHEGAGADRTWIHVSGGFRNGAVSRYRYRCAFLTGAIKSNSTALAAVSGDYGSSGTDSNETWTIVQSGLAGGPTYLTTSERFENARMVAAQNGNTIAHATVECATMSNQEKMVTDGGLSAGATYSTTWIFQFFTRRVDAAGSFTQASRAWEQRGGASC